MTATEFDEELYDGETYRAKFDDEPYRAKLHHVQPMFAVKIDIANPLPDPYEGDAYHYTDVHGVEAIIRNNTMLASHIQAMNDPSERDYGWKAIEDRYKERFKGALNTDAQNNLEEIFERRTCADWYPDVFAVSASMRHDSLDQFRMYGMYEIRLPSRVIWTQMKPEGVDPLEYWSVWRPVIYGSGNAVDNIDRLIRSAAYMFDQDFHPLEINSYESVATAIETLAMYIKHGAYESEQEVRLVFTAKGPHSCNPQVRVSNGKLITYLTAHIEEEDYIFPFDGSTLQPFAVPKVVQGVHLGPLANDSMTIAALKQLGQNFQQDIDREYRFRVSSSRHPYRMAATK